MSITIMLIDSTGLMPWPIGMRLECDAKAESLCRGEEMFVSPDGFVGTHRAAMQAGWLERSTPQDRLWLCPACSGKAAMSSDLDIPPYLKRTKDNQVPQFSKPIVYSYTLLKTADTCLYKCFRQYIKKDLPFDKTPEIEWGNKVHEAMEHRIGGKPLPAEMRHWEPIVAAYVERGARAEKKTGITKDCKPTGFFDNDVWLRCKVDVTMLLGSNIFISDFKTGSSKYEDPFELEIQALTLKAAIPAVNKIAGHYAWLKENRIGETHDLSDFNAIWAKINNKVEAIEDCMASGEWPKTKNPLCGWCGVLDCENNPKGAK